MTMDHRPSMRYSRPVRVVGFDFGERRIGVAVSDASGTLARPLKTIQRGPSDAEAIERLHATIEELAAEDAIGSVVVGLPTRLDGSPNRQTARIGAMVTLLSARLAVPVFTQDERLSSHEAEERLSLGEKDWRKRKAKLDAAAAAVILQDYLDARTLTGQREEGRGQKDDEKEEPGAARGDGAPASERRGAGRRGPRD
jgi:putative holliday junction resolvase